MSTAAWTPVSLAVVSAGVGCPRPAHRPADWITEAVCRSLTAGGARAEVEVLELHRLAADLAQHSIQGRVSLDLREAIAAVVAADGLVVATPVRAASPSKVFDSFLAILGDKVLSGMPVPLAQQRIRPAATRHHTGDAQAPDCRARRARAHGRRRRPRRLAGHGAQRRGCAPASTEPPSNSPRRCARTSSNPALASNSK
ncbi:NAD(P)H-dependent oxidoreductase [Streptomyces sp. GB4-14]|uniref:NAD(P)H-dependent oxidoreductase n=1 Tax=Streptomyces sp. GB4-14 TaxID=2498703 RepID=UPI001F5CCB9B